MDDGATDGNYRWKSKFGGKDDKLTFASIDFEVFGSTGYMKINGQDWNNTFESFQHISSWYLNYKIENSELGKKPWKS